MREAWIEQFTAAARAHWTPERTAELTGGKRLAILPGEAPMLLRALGLLHRDATMPPAQMRKFLQINHVVRVIEHAMEGLLARHAGEPVTIVDAGCGRSYLTLLVAQHWRDRVRVIGIDRNAAVIEECKRRTAIAGLDEVVTFRAAAVEEAGEGLAAHAVFALHACDTATDDAIALGVRLGAELIAVAPCCQAELARGWAALEATAGAFSPIWRAPHLRRETATHVTDAMRVLLLRARGYATTPMEFIAAEHTKKNTLIRAELRGDPDPAARAEYAALVAATGGCGISLGALI